MTDDTRILARVADGVGHATLNRPEALNALTHGMIQRLDRILRDWAGDPAVRVVVLDGAGERGFCAGGDVRTLFDNADAGANDASREFFRDEYRLDALIGEYPKPVVALMDGITMGGGIGLAGHASIRVVTERSRLAMPETRIGFTPDVGGSGLLARAPGELGLHLGLTAATMDGADAVALGFADHLMASSDLPVMLAALAGCAAPDAGPGARPDEDDSARTPAHIVRGFAQTPRPSAMLARRRWVDACYEADTVPGILERLRTYAAGARLDEVDESATDGAVFGSADADRPDANGADFDGSGFEESGFGGPGDDAERIDDEGRADAAAAASALEMLSPTALTVAFAAIRRARTLPDLRAVLDAEFGLVSWFLDHPDLREGIRAQVVDKDRSPRWSPTSLDDIPTGLTEQALANPAPLPLW